MRIAVAGSMQHTEKMLRLVEDLENLGHVAFTSKFAQDYVGKSDEDKENTKLRHKYNNDAIREFWKPMALCGALLVANYDKSGIRNYIGGNSFLEMGFAHILGLPIYLLNPIPELSYSTEIVAMRPIIINQDLSRIPLTSPVSPIVTSRTEVDATYIASEVVRNCRYFTAATVNKDSSPLSTPLYMVRDDNLRFFTTSSMHSEHLQNIDATRKAFLSGFDACINQQTQIAQGVYFECDAKVVTDDQVVISAIKIDPSSKLGICTPDSLLGESARRLIEFRPHQGWINTRVLIGEVRTDERLGIDLELLKSLLCRPKQFDLSSKTA